MYRTLTYEPARDFAPITLAALAPTMLVAHPPVPASTLPELIAYGKQQPRRLQFATAGAGTNNHVAMEIFAHAAGLQMIHAPYTGGGQQVNALLAGQVDATMQTPGAMAGIRA